LPFPARGAQPSETAIFRIFLQEGEPLVSYGDFARVADRVVFSVPLDTAMPPALQMVSIPAAAVDWRRTEEYAYAVRARRYAETRGEEDFTLLASRVTQALNDINLTADPARRLAMAQEARGNLAAWPSANFGYRAADVGQLVAMLDDVITEMRAASGGGTIALSLVATTVPPPLVALLPPPDARATLDAAFRAALSSAEPGERVALLRSLLQRTAFPDGAAWRSRIAAALNAELEVDRAYGDLARAALRDAQQRVERGDVRSLQQAIERVLAGDDRLGRRRPGEVSALLAALDLRLSEAARVLAAREAWAARLDDLKAYRRVSEPARRRLAGLRGLLRDIREGRRVSRSALHRIEIHATMAIHELRVITAPPEMASAHGVTIAALQLARQAAALRRDALSSNGSQRALDASSAAAGALMLAERAADDINRLISEAPSFPR
jgi:hypothetical protein